MEKDPKSIPVQKKDPKSIPVQKKDPKSIPVQKKKKHRNVKTGKCSLLVKVACLNLMIIAAGLSLTAINVADQIYCGTYARDSKKDGFKANFALGMVLFPIFCLAVPLIWANLVFVAKRQLKSDVNAALKIIRFCQMSSLILIVIGLVGGFVAFPDIHLIIWMYFLIFDAMLFAAFFHGMRLERASKFNTELEKKTTKEEAQKPELFAVKIDII